MGQVIGLVFEAVEAQIMVVVHKSDYGGAKKKQGNYSLSPHCSLRFKVIAV